MAEGEGQGDRLLHVRPALPRRRGPPQAAAARAEGEARGAPRRPAANRAAVLFRPCRRQRRGDAAARLRDAASKASSPSAPTRPTAPTAPRPGSRSKCGFGQEFVIVGWRPSDVKARPFSSILLGVREGDRLSYRGRVGSGFGERELDELWPELQKRAVKTPPADDVPADVRRQRPFRQAGAGRRDRLPRLHRRGLCPPGQLQGTPQGQAGAGDRRRDPGRCAGSADQARPAAPRPRRRQEVAVPKPSPSSPSTRPGTTRRSRSRAYASPIPTRWSFRGTASPSASSPNTTCSSRTASCPTSSTGRSPGALSRRRGGRLLLPEARLAGLPRRLQADPHQGEGGERRLSLHRGRSRPDRLRADGRRWSSTSGARTTTRSRSPTASSSTSTRTRTWPSPRCGTRRKDMRDRLAALGLETFPMVTGGKGIHVVAPLTPRVRLGRRQGLLRGGGADHGRGGAEALPRGRHQGQAERHASSSTTCATAAARRRSARSRPAPSAARRCRGR